MIYYESPSLEYSFAHTLKNIQGDNIKHYLHNHNSYEILYLLKGDVEYNIESEKYIVSEGEMIVVNCAEFHSLKILTPKIYNRMVIEVTKPFLLDLTKEIDLFKFFKLKKDGLNNLIPKESVLEYGLDKYLWKLRGLTKSKDAENELRIKCILSQLLLDINNIFKKKHTLPGESSNNNLVKQIMLYITDNLSGNLDLDALSEKFFISKYHLCHLFKKETGITPNIYTQTKRVHAANLLIQSGVSSHAACFQLGFNDYSTFYRAFKKYLKKSPTD